MKIVRGTALTGITRAQTKPGEVYEMIGSSNKDDVGRLIMRIADGAPNSTARTTPMQCNYRFVELATGIIRLPGGGSIRYQPIDAILNVKED